MVDDQLLHFGFALLQLEAEVSAAPPPVVAGTFTPISRACSRAKAIRSAREISTATW